MTHSTILPWTKQSLFPASSRHISLVLKAYTHSKFVPSFLTPIPVLTIKVEFCRSVKIYYFAFLLQWSLNPCSDGAKIFASMELRLTTFYVSKMRPCI